MTTPSFLQVAMAVRTQAGFGIAVHGIEGRDTPYTVYAKDAAQLERVVSKYEALGCRVVRL